MRLPIETERLVLREAALADWRAIDAYNRAPEFHRYLPIDAPDAAATRGFVHLCLARAREQPRRHYDAVVCARADGAVIGTLRLSLRERGVADLGYAIRPDRWGSGFAAEAVAALLAAARARLGLREVWASVDPDNVASRRVLEKLAFRHCADRLGAPVKPGRPPSRIFALDWREAVSERTVRKAVEVRLGCF